MTFVLNIHWRWAELRRLAVVLWHYTLSPVAYVSKTNRPTSSLVSPDLFQGGRKPRSRTLWVGEWFRGTHNRSPQLQQDMVSVMGVWPCFTVFADVIGRAEAVGKQRPGQNGRAGSTWAGSYQTRVLHWLHIPLVVSLGCHPTMACFINKVSNT